MFYFILCFLRNTLLKVNLVNDLGHDIKADINRRCNPFFNVQNTVQKKEKLKEINSDV